MSTRLRTSTIVAALVAAPSLAQGQCQYEVTIIEGPPCSLGPPTAAIFPAAINESGEVVGSYHVCIGTDSRAFYWSEDTGLITLPMPDGIYSMGASDINDNGTICGTWSRTNVGFRGFVYWPESQTYTELDTVTGQGESMAYAINNASTVVGERSTGDYNSPQIAFIWSAQAGFHNLESVGVPSEALDIADDGHVVGEMPRNLGFLLTEQSLTVIPPIPGGQSCHPRSVNQRGQVGGTSVTAGLTTRGFIWTEGLYEVILPVGDDTLSSVTAVSDLGHALIHSWRDSVPHPYLWVGGEYFDIRDFMPSDSPLVVEKAVSINEVGQILVGARLPGEGDRALVLSPVAQPHTDLTADCVTGVHDLLVLLSLWGQNQPAADFTGDGTVNVFDLLELLGNWSQLNKPGQLPFSCDSRPRRVRWRE